MSTTHLDAKGRLLIPRRVRQAARLEGGEELVLKVPEEGTVLLRRVGGAPGGPDPLLKALERPAHASPSKLRKLNLETLKDEAWTP